MQRDKVASGECTSLSLPNLLQDRHHFMWLVCLVSSSFLFPLLLSTSLLLQVHIISAGSQVSQVRLELELLISLPLPFMQKYGHHHIRQYLGVCFEAGSYCLAQAGFEVAILLP